MDPNTYNLVLDTLNRALSQNADVLKPAEKKLQEWEIEPGFYSVLLDILSNHGIDANVRWLAVMCFKNGVDRYWRKNAPNAISEEEKHKLRSGLLTTNILSEPFTQVATQLAVLISKIARFDCPQNWPNLVPDLLGGLKAPQPVIQQRALLTFHHTVKTLASKRLLSDRRTFQELTSTVYSYILNLWDEYTQNFLRYIQNGSDTDLITENLEKALLTLRILRKLTVFGFKKLNESQEAMSFLNIVFERAKTSLECRKLLKGRGIDPLQLCEKFIIHLTKVALGVLETDPLSYMPLITPSLEFTLFYCFTEHGMTFIYERFTIQCLNIIKGILLCVEYNVDFKVTILEREGEETASMQAHRLKMTVLQTDTVCHMCRHLVSHYFLLTGDDLALWDAEPESFATDEAGESWKYSLRPCTESVFLALFHEFRHILASELVRLLSEIQQQTTLPNDLTALLRKDAVYNAVGLAAFDLYDEIDFDEWFTKVLNQELQVQDNNYRIIRRRVAWLIGQWSGVRASPELRPMLYEALLQLLGGPRAGGALVEDAAVRLAAADALRAVVDDFSFNADQFEPYTPRAFSGLLDLLNDAEECETKMHVLHVISLVVERNSGAVAEGRAAGLVACLPGLWARAANHHMLQAAVVSTLVNLVKALGTWEGALRPLVLGVVAEAAAPARPAHVYLLEDALELWLAALETAAAPDAGLMNLAHSLPPLLEESSEHLRILVYIMQAYALLSGEEFVCGAGERCVAVLADMLADLRSEGTLAVLKLAETCARVPLPPRCALLAVRLVWPILLQVVRGLMQNDELPMVLSVQLTLMARVILMSPELFYKLIEECSTSVTEYNCDSARVLGQLLDVWTSRMKLVSQVERSKVIGMGLAVLLTTQNPVVLQRFGAIFSNITDMLHDVLKPEESGYTDGLASCSSCRAPSPPDALGVVASAGRWGAEGTPHDARRTRLAALDYPRTAHIASFLHAQIEALKSQVSAETYHQLWQTVDTETVRQLREYMII